MLEFRAVAPSNIALIKYMGKRDPAENLPCNPSLSITLNRLNSSARVVVTDGPEPQRVAGSIGGDPLGDRLSRHLSRVMEPLRATLSEAALDVCPRGLVGVTVVNSFPSSSGIASSASCFASATLALALSQLRDGSLSAGRWSEDTELRAAVASMARMGSGSSCRSFFGPWCAWDDRRVFRLDFRALPRLADLVLMVSSAPKAVPSSEAHRRARLSGEWSRGNLSRPERASSRYLQLTRALEADDWASIVRIARDEAWDMHSLFWTADPPFDYFLPKTREILEVMIDWRINGREAIVTLDAGPNPHVIVPEEDAPAWRERVRSRWADVEILDDLQGSGAAFMDPT